MNTAMMQTKLPSGCPLPPHVTEEQINSDNIEIFTWLNLLVGVHQRNAEIAGKPIRPYVSHADLIFQRGKLHTYASLPNNIVQGTPRECFSNAARLVLNDPTDSYLYVEGFAMGYAPTEHAWCIDRNGIVIDNTWNAMDLPTRQYFGVAFDTDFLTSRLMDTGMMAIMFWDQEKCPLLNGEIDLDTAIVDIDSWRVHG